MKVERDEFLICYFTVYLVLDDVVATAVHLVCSVCYEETFCFDFVQLR